MSWYFIIAPFRAPKSAKIYKELWEHGDNASPLKTITQDLAERLNKELKEDSILKMARATRILLDVVLEEMRQLNYDKIIILPLFPIMRLRHRVQRFKEVWKLYPNGGSYPILKSPELNFTDEDFTFRH